MSKPIYSMIHEPFGLDSVSIADPGAQTNFRYVMPFDYLYRLLSVNLTFTSDATVANRLVSVAASIGSSDVFVCNAPLIQDASKVYTYNFSSRPVPYIPVPLALRIPATISPDFLLPPGATIHSIIDSIQAADAISDITLFLQWFPIPR